MFKRGYTSLYRFPTDSTQTWVFGIAFERERDKSSDSLVVSLWWIMCNLSHQVTVALLYTYCIVHLVELHIGFIFRSCGLATNKVLHKRSLFRVNTVEMEWKRELAPSIQVFLVVRQRNLCENVLLCNK